MVATGDFTATELLHAIVEIYRKNRRKRLENLSGQPGPWKSNRMQHLRCNLQQAEMTYSFMQTKEVNQPQAQPGCRTGMTVSVKKGLASKNKSVNAKQYLRTVSRGFQPRTEPCFMTQDIKLPPHNAKGNGLPFKDRRVNTTDRRKTEDRRRQKERRYDDRLSPGRRRKSLKAWFRSKTRIRLGVDRRKTGDRRVLGDRRRQALLRSILTREEIDDLLR